MAKPKKASIHTRNQVSIDRRIKELKSSNAELKNLIRFLGSLIETDSIGLQPEQLNISLLEKKLNSFGLDNNERLDIENKIRKGKKTPNIQLEKLKSLHSIQDKLKSLIVKNDLEIREIKQHGFPKVVSDTRILLELPVINKQPERNTPPPLEMPKDDKPASTTPDLTTRGTPRVRKPRRQRNAAGNDPRLEINRDDVKLGGRIPRKLHAAFVKKVADNNEKQGTALTKLVQLYTYGPDYDK